jgi:hypothetical protein
VGRQNAAIGCELGFLWRGGEDQALLLNMFKWPSQLRGRIQPGTMTIAWPCVNLQFTGDGRLLAPHRLNATHDFDGSLLRLGAPIWRS